MARILLVDEPNALVDFFQKLQYQGHDCHWVSGGHEAVQSVMAQCPELVVLNPNLRGTEGLRTLEAIKELDENICVILYSDASLFGESFDYFLADFVLSKQPGHGALLKVVAEKISHHENSYPTFHEGFY